MAVPKTGILAVDVEEAVAKRIVVLSACRPGEEVVTTGVVMKTMSATVLGCIEALGCSEVVLNAARADAFDCEEENIATAAT